ncbi:MAG: hypothetical protein JXB04_00010 [Kiritimatiellae bacterium]|nr:hypothetical protein [Kiritimatiellia bacterium]
MKKWLAVILCVGLSVSMGLFVGCEWSSGGGDDSFNTSRGAGININFSGVYNGMLGGGRAVAQTSGAGAISRLVISQGGNTVEVTDNQGSTYRGSVGSPGAVSSATGGSYPAGAELVQAQITWSGKDEVAQRDVEFVGVIHVIAVTDIQGTTSADTSSDSDTDTETKTYKVVQGGKTNIVQETIVVTPIGSTKTTITIDGETGEELSRVSEEISTDTSSTSATTTFSITEANSQYRLEGTWIEDGGVSAQVDARSAGTSGIITTAEATE